LIFTPDPGIMPSAGFAWDWANGVRALISPSRTGTNDVVVQISSISRDASESEGLDDVGEQPTPQASQKATTNRAAEEIEHISDLPD
jgi:hypothetical protein